MNQIFVSSVLSKNELQSSIQTQNEEVDEEINDSINSMSGEYKEIEQISAIKRVQGLKRSNQKKRNSNFTIEEDRRLLKLVTLKGPKFHVMLRNFKGKSVSVLKNRYYKNLRYRWSEILGDAYTHLDCQYGDSPYQPSQQSDLREVENLLNTQPNLYPETKQILEQMLQGFVKVFSNAH